jgi:hypothetical protein
MKRVKQLAWFAISEVWRTDITVAGQLQSNENYLCGWSTIYFDESLNLLPQFIFATKFSCCSRSIRFPFSCMGSVAQFSHKLSINATNFHISKRKFFDVISSLQHMCTELTLMIIVKNEKAENNIEKVAFWALIIHQCQSESEKAKVREVVADVIAFLNVPESLFTPNDNSTGSFGQLLLQVFIFFTCQCETNLVDVLWCGPRFWWTRNNATLCNWCQKRQNMRVSRLWRRSEFFQPVHQSRRLLTPRYTFRHGLPYNSMDSYIIAAIIGVHGLGYAAQVAVGSFRRCVYTLLSVVF